MASLLDTHDVADLISLVSQELPVSTNVAFQEAQTEANKIMVSVFDIDNLTASAFINSHGGVVKLNSDTLKDRPEGIKYFCFGCQIYPAVEDKRVTQAPHAIQFCLKLPQHVYHVTDGRIVKANSPKKKKDKMASMFAGAAQRLDFGASSDQSDDKDSGEDKDAYRLSLAISDRSRYYAEIF